ncbi:MAG: diacylglycerol kinase family lipid kinase [Bacteroidetes bacterium]|nr:diacylglycerol kinase family lipid kinase [Bacteroidota bacterium]
MRKIRFIINPKSGATDKHSFTDWINSNIDRSIFECEITHTTAPHHATALARDAAENNFDIVVAVGGDGSVNETGAGLIGTKTALGIIPTGSGNGMARHMKIPIHFQKAVALLNTGTNELVDTLTVNNRPCIGTFGIGFDAHIAHLFAGAGTRGYSTYVKLVLAEFSKYKPVYFKIFADKKEYHLNCFLLTFANSSQFGNNAVIAPFADVKDGIIDISMLQKFPAYVAPHLVYRMMNNSIHNSRFFDRLNAKEILVRNETIVKGHIDGEPVELEGDIEIKVKPLSLNIVTSK